METIKYFDYYKIAGEMNISQDIVNMVEKEVKKEFPDDRMMFELHVMRALKSRYWESVSL
ncbi:MAG: hypothetical protein JXB88_17840 [Spirochaetales bacterium]|nr:hypothetical protein [Spirochaetales bacterium]